MRKTIIPIYWALALMIFVPKAALAVWAPSTTASEADRKAQEVEVLTQLNQLKRDEERLSEALRDLKKDREKLERLLDIKTR